MEKQAEKNKVLIAAADCTLSLTAGGSKAGEFQHGGGGAGSCANLRPRWQIPVQTEDNGAPGLSVQQRVIVGMRSAPGKEEQRRAKGAI